jgi:hypothetical protein
MCLVHTRGQLGCHAIQIGTEAWQNGVPYIDQAMHASTLDTRCDVCAVALGILELDEQAVRIIRVDIRSQVEGLPTLNQGSTAP